MSLPYKYRVESNRNRYWDYSQPGLYFITICVENRDCILGKIVRQQMKYSQYGELVKNEILNIPNYHNQLQLKEWVVMLNHIHLIIKITEPIAKTVTDDDGTIADDDGSIADDGGTIRIIAPPLMK